MIQSRKGFNEAVEKAQQSSALNDQLAFKLYACAKETTRKYKLLLRETGLTYTQYLAMLVLWEKGTMNVKTLGEQLYLDSGTLTPMLKKMEEMGFVSRSRKIEDERNVYFSVTEKGKKLKNEVTAVEAKMRAIFPLGRIENNQLSVMLDKILRGLEAE